MEILTTLLILTSTVCSSEKLVSHDINHVSQRADIAVSTNHVLKGRIVENGLSLGPEASNDGRVRCALS